ncbi:MAG: response regulator [Caldilineaceae bacterium]|nr:response regulator [Caldilineaceae bacterium]
MGGTMWVESNVGEGTTFHFTVESKVAADISGFMPIYEDLLGRRVLIVDDNNTNRRILAEMCRRWGMVPTASASADAALALVKQGKEFDVAVLDMLMPGMTGVQLGEALHALKPRTAFPIVIMTSLGAGSPNVGARPMSFAAWLTKPVKHSQLRETLTQILRREPVSLARPLAVAPFDNLVADKIPLRILLAEDNVVNQKVALRILERFGYDADVVANGDEAVEALKRQHYDLVLMDVHMPELDGIEATRIIRGHLPANSQPLIFAMTAAALTDDRQACLDAGMDGYITKPVKVEQLAEVLRRVQTVPAVWRNGDGTPHTDPDTCCVMPE